MVLEESIKFNQSIEITLKCILILSIDNEINETLI